MTETTAEAIRDGDHDRAPRPRRSSVEAAFRAGIEARLRSLEGEMGEIKARLNGLLFFIAGTVIAQVLLRLFA